MQLIGEEVMRLKMARSDDLPEDATHAFVYSPRDCPRVYVYFSRLLYRAGFLCICFLYSTVKAIDEEVLRLTMARADVYTEDATRAFVCSPREYLLAFLLIFVFVPLSSDFLLVYYESRVSSCA